MSEQNEAIPPAKQEEKVVFLDVAGVMITRPSLETPSFEKEPVANITQLLEETGAELVITTTALNHDPKMVWELVQEAGLDRFTRQNDADMYRWRLGTEESYIEDKAPYIRQWLTVHDVDAKNAVVLDDSRLFRRADPMAQRQILVDDSIGLSDTDVLKAKEKLGVRLNAQERDVMGGKSDGLGAG